MGLVQSYNCATSITIHLQSFSRLLQLELHIHKTLISYSHFISSDKYHSAAVSMNLATLGTSLKWNHTIVILLWLAISVSIISSRFTHVLACIRNSLLLMLCVFIFAPPFIHLQMTQDVFTFKLLWIMLLWT